MILYETPSTLQINEDPGIMTHEIARSSEPFKLLFALYEGP